MPGLLDNPLYPGQGLTMGGFGLAPFGLRHSGQAPKGMGFFGLLQNPHGGYSSELSTEFDIGGKRIEAPLLVPTLTAAEIHAVLAGGQLPDSVYEKAYSHARQRMRLGMNPFAGPSDLHHPMPED